jgi:hypothetical protein
VLCEGELKDFELSVSELAELFVDCELNELAEDCEL